MSQQDKPFAWSLKSVRAAQLVAEDRLTNEEIAEECCVARRTIDRWKTHPDFLARVDELIEAFRRTSERVAIAQRGRRVAALNDRWHRMRRVIEERAASEDMQGIPGGETGLLVHQVKGIGRGENFQVVHEYVVDDGLLGELRAHERQAAQELDQWTERHDVDVRDQRSGEELERKLAQLAARLCGVGGEAAAGAETGVPGEPER